MDAVKRWAVIENGAVVNTILADEAFILSQSLNAVEDYRATTGVPVDEDGNIQYTECISPVESPAN